MIFRCIIIFVPRFVISVHYFLVLNVTDDVGYVSVKTVGWQDAHDTSRPSRTKTPGRSGCDQVREMPVSSEHVAQTEQSTSGGGCFDVIS